MVLDRLKCVCHFLSDGKIYLLIEKYIRAKERLWESILRLF